MLGELPLKLCLSGEIENPPGRLEQVLMSSHGPPCLKYTLLETQQFDALSQTFPLLAEALRELSKPVCSLAFSFQFSLRGVQSQTFHKGYISKGPA